MKKMLVLLVVLGVVGTAMYAFAVPETVVFEAKNGNVTFEHAKHSGAECVTCHHEGSNDASCRSCHDGTTASATKSPRGEFHQFCIACHKENGMKGMCNECHVK